MAAVADTGAVQADALHIISWNVAGWKTTVEHIRRFRGGLPAWLERHRADVLCLQEVKLTSKAIAAEAVVLGAETAGYDTFWACNEGAGGQRQGLNGVATFARQGAVLRADDHPLQVPELDKEGRCLLTDHGHFVIFNVYVPNNSGGTRLPFKVRWLRALRSAMQRERAAGKAVILLGDLNMKLRTQDMHWSYLPIQAAGLADLPCLGELSAEEQSIVAAAHRAWPDVREAIRLKEHRSIETRNSRNSQVYQRWGVFARATSGDVVKIGSPVESADAARGSFAVDGVGVEEDGTVVYGPASLEAAYALRRPGVLCACDLAECLKKLAGIEVPPRLLRRLALAMGRLGTEGPVHDWLRGALGEDGMVDSFAELYPSAEERFTCWDQYRNKRHENVGSRIDYVLVDRPLFERCACRGAGLEARKCPSADLPAAAAAAATLGGLSQPSSFAGGGMPALEEDEYLAQFREEASTGIIYTPPQLSDHVAVSLLLQGLGPARAPGEGGLARDARTQRCQPHRSAKRITDFFARRPSKTDCDSAPPPAKRTALGA